jgi:hypothetical protein
MQEDKASKLKGLTVREAVAQEVMALNSHTAN